MGDGKRGSGSAEERQRIERDPVRLVELAAGESGDAAELLVDLRGLDARAYYRMSRGKLVNDTGTGNTVAETPPT